MPPGSMCTIESKINYNHRFSFDCLIDTISSKGEKNGQNWKVESIPSYSIWNSVWNDEYLNGNIPALTSKKKTYQSKYRQ